MSVDIDIEAMSPLIQQGYLNVILQEHAGVQLDFQEISQARGLQKVMAILIPIFNGQGVWNKGDIWFAQVKQGGRIEQAKDPIIAINKCLLLSHLLGEMTVSNMAADSVRTRKLGRS